MGQVSFNDGEYEINHSDYMGNYGGMDNVCQVKKHGREVAHCTMHPNNLNRHSSCPYRGNTYCRFK